MMKKTLTLLILTSLCIQLAEAQVVVAKSSNRKLAINLAGMSISSDTSAQIFIQTLETDLKRSGWFKPQRTPGDLQLNGSVGEKRGKLSVSCQLFRAGDRKNLLSSRYSAKSDQPEILAHRVADELVYAATGRKGIASTKIAAICSRGRTKEVYVFYAGGGGLTQLTKDRSIAVAPKWTPAGDGLVFTSYFRKFPDSYHIDLKTGKRSVLSKYSGLNSGAVISPNGKEMAITLSKDGNPELYIKDLKTGQLRRLTKTNRATEASPSWSPDGQRLVYVSDQSGSPQLYIISRTGGRPQRLSRRGTENVSPDWGKNGWITCASRSGGRYVIAIIQPSTGTTRYLTNDGADYEDPSWAPDGRHLVASRTVGGQSGLYLLDTVSDPPVALLRDSRNWVSPAWSPR